MKCSFKILSFSPQLIYVCMYVRIYGCIYVCNFIGLELMTPKSSLTEPARHPSFQFIYVILFPLKSCRKFTYLCPHYQNINVLECVFFSLLELNVEPLLKPNFSSPGIFIFKLRSYMFYL